MQTNFASNLVGAEAHEIRWHSTHIETNRKAGTGKLQIKYEIQHHLSITNLSPNHLQIPVLGGCLSYAQEGVQQRYQ